MLCLELPTEQFKAKCFIWCYQQSSWKGQNALFGVINGAVRSNISEVINKAVRSKMFRVELSSEQFEAKYFIWSYKRGSSKQHIWNYQQGSSKPNVLCGVIIGAVRGKMLYLESEATCLKWSTRHLKQTVLFGVLMLISSVGWNQTCFDWMQSLGNRARCYRSMTRAKRSVRWPRRGQLEGWVCKWTNVLRSIRN